MIVKFKVNLGSVDAARCDVDFRQCVIDAEVNVSEAAGKWLVGTGVAVDVTPAPPPKPEAKPEPVVVQDQAVEEAQAESTEPTEQNTKPTQKKTKP